ncbi:MAG: metallophosphoesterase, partial [Desulfococcaceae bacterium]|nr:metallophosphoesterase [Desulfococcaceae bacterium]
MPECFTWLHLTDLHAGMKNQGWLWPDIKEKFFEDLKKLTDKSGPVDLVLFTGDLTQKGSAEEFEKVDSILTELWKVLKESGSEPVFLAVPGNHDLLRPADEEDPLLILLTQWNEQPKVREKFWNDQNTSYHQIVNRSFENYRNWWNRLTIKPDNINDGMLPGDFSATVRKENAKLGIVGLNTAFLQLNSSDYKEKLAIHARQFHKACGGDGPDWIKQHHACLFMTHHPVSWLNREAQQQVNEHIMAYGRFAVHLCGHMHETVYRNTEEAGTEARRLWQGRSLFGLEYFGDKKERREFGYNIGKIELAETQGKLFFFPRQ